MPIYLHYTIFIALLPSSSYCFLQQNLIFLSGGDLVDSHSAIKRKRAEAPSIHRAPGDSIH